MNAIERNALHLQTDFQWLERVIRFRLNHHTHDTAPPHVPFEILALDMPELNGHASGYHTFIYSERLSASERLLLLLALAPYLNPHSVRELLLLKDEDGRMAPEVGGVTGKSSNQFQPTGESALFLLAGVDFTERMKFLPLLDPFTELFASGALEWVAQQPYDLPLNHLLKPSRELLEAFTQGRAYRPPFGPEFPAKIISTQLNWKDLILQDQTMRHLGDIKTWVQHGDTLLKDWGMGNRLKPGYRALFYGPPGTGKTLTASLLGKEAMRDVYRVDLSTVVSKYIGETEKNLERVFARAERRNWILFFDEADAIFGKRTKVKDSHDRFANQEVSYLLQRVEDFDGIVILASNEKENMDDAFARRFQSMIYFPMPKAEERYQLWLTNFPAAAELEPGINLYRIAERYEISGGSILNVVRYCAMEAVKREQPLIRQRDIEEGLRREFQKLGKMM